MQADDQSLPFAVKVAWHDMKDGVAVVPYASSTIA
jgi:hypothetical protein